MGKHKVRLRLKVKIEKSQKIRNILLKITAILIILAVSGFVVNKTARFLLTSPVFNVKSIEVRGAGIIEKDAILNCLAFCGKNIFLLKLKKTESQLTEEFVAKRSMG